MLGAIVRRAIILSVVAARIMFAQAPAAKDPPKYVPTEVQALKLQLLQKDAQLAQLQLQRFQDAIRQSKDNQDLQEGLKKAIEALQAEAGKVKETNKWPADVAFHMEDLTFSAPSASPPPTPPAKPAEPPAPAKPKEKP
jgi:hypothetical protein